MYLGEEIDLTSCDLTPEPLLRHASGDLEATADSSLRGCHEHDQSLSIIAWNEGACMVNIAQLEVVSAEVQITDQCDWREGTCDDSEPY
jgi:hypothetical protein